MVVQQHALRADCIDVALKAVVGQGLGMFLAAWEGGLLGDEGKGLGVGGRDVLTPRNGGWVVRVGIKLLVLVVKIVIVISEGQTILIDDLCRQRS
jgi:hypothetical protein